MTTLKQLKKGSRVVTRDTNEEGTVTYVWSTGEHVDVWLDEARSAREGEVRCPLELIRIEDLELL